MGACTRHETGKQEYVKMRLAPIALVRKLIQTAGGGTQNRPKATLLMGKSETVDRLTQEQFARHRTLLFSSYTE